MNYSLLYVMWLDELYLMTNYSDKEKMNDDYSFIDAMYDCLPEGEYSKNAQKWNI